MENVITKSIVNVKEKINAFLNSKAWTNIVKANTFILCIAAILCGTSHWLGSFVFMYTSLVGIIDGKRIHNIHCIVINLAFLCLNGYFTYGTITAWLS